jgi:pimeloyl-ACP methyl ester carboxylesterase
MITQSYLNFDGYRMAYHVAGTGRDVLLIHGWLSSGRMWEGVMRSLSTRYRVWAVDLIGFGDSPLPDDFSEGSGALSVAWHTETIVRFCDALNLNPYAVIGHSMGGSVALKLALDHGHRFEKLGLICPVVTGRFAWNLEQILLYPLVQKILNYGQHVWDHIKNISNYTPFAWFVAPNYLEADFARRSLEDFHKATWAATYYGLLSLMNIHLETRLHSIPHQTLIVTGSYDYTVPPADSRLAAQLIPDAVLLELPDCHHQPPDECPELFEQELWRFLVANALKTSAA